MDDKFQPEEASKIKPTAPEQAVPQIGTVVDPSQAQGTLYQVHFHVGMTTKSFDFRVATDMSAVMAALFLAIRKYPLVHTVTIVEKETDRIVCYVPLLGIEKSIGPQLVAVGEGPSIAAASALPAGKNFEDIRKEVRFKGDGVRR